MTNQNYLAELMGVLLTDLRENESVNQEVLNRLKDWISKKINIEILPTEFDDLHLMMQSMWKYGNIQDLPENQASAYGALWFATDLLEQSRIYQEERIQGEVLLKTLESKNKLRLVLEVMKENPGLNHSELAKKCELSTSYLSQIFSNDKTEVLYRFNRIGREKYYYISELGKDLMDKAPKSIPALATNNKMDETLIETVRRCFENYNTFTIRDKVFKEALATESELNKFVFSDGSDCLINEYIQLDQKMSLISDKDNVSSVKKETTCQSLLKGLTERSSVEKVSNISDKSNNEKGFLAALVEDNKPYVKKHSRARWNSPARVCCSLM